MKNLGLLLVIDRDSERLAPAALGAGADADEAIHLGAKVHRIAARPGARHRVAHASRLAVDHHRLKNIQRTRDVFLGDFIGLQRPGEIFPAAVLGRDDLFSAELFPGRAVDGEDPIAPLLVEGRAAHPLLHIVSSGISVFHDRHHHVVVFGDKHVAGRDVDFPLIDFRARLIEALFDVPQIEDDEVRGGFAGHANDPAFFHDERLAAIFWNYVFGLRHDRLPAE